MATRLSVVCLALVLAALAGCGGATRTVTVAGPPAKTSATGAPTHTQAGKTTPGRPAPAPTTILHMSSFRSPSGNIGCVLIGVARCDIARRSWSPPARPSSCPNIVDYGQGLEVGVSGGARLVCAGDTARDPSAPTLAYGEGSQVGPFLCVSRTDGMTCRDGSDGHGFFISIASYRAF